MEQILLGAPVAKQLDEISKNVFQKHSKDNQKPHLTAITAVSYTHLTLPTKLEV